MIPAANLLGKEGQGFSIAMQGTAFDFNSCMVWSCAFIHACLCYEQVSITITCVNFALLAVGYSFFKFVKIPCRLATHYYIRFVIHNLYFL